MPRVELLCFPDCPHVAAARLQLERAFARVGLEPHWQELDMSAPDSPLPIRGLGSPTILIDGVDVSGALTAAGDSCRLYEGGSGAPPLDTIVAALQASLRRSHSAHGVAR